MSTKDKILHGARALFNADGYSGAAALDVATALGISPGHLYYHFKGKVEIAQALFFLHEEEISIILSAAEDAAHQDGKRRVTLATYLHIILEEMEDNRFFYREFAVLARERGGLAQGYARLARAERAMLATCLRGVAPAASIAAWAEALQLGLWALPGHMEILGAQTDPRARAEEGAARLMGLVDLIAGPATAREGRAVKPGKTGRKSKR